MAYGLRVYLPSDHPYKGNEIGLEQHPNDYIKNLVEVSREIMRVLRKDGSYYLVLGDTYWGGGQGGGTYGSENGEKNAPPENYPRIARSKSEGWLKPKQKMLIPYRVAIALQDDGWICRNDIVWYKLNAMPSSVKDRLTCTTERMFHFVKSRHYYYNLDIIRIPHSQSSIERYERALEFGAKNREGSKASFNQYGFMDCDKRTGVPKSFNLRVRDVKHGKGGLSTFGVLKVSEEECENYQYPEKFYRGKFSGMGEKAEDYGSPRARTQRASKFLTPEGMLNKGASPGARSVLDKDKFSHVRKKIQEVNQYLKDRLKACNLNVKKLAELTDLCETTIAHYFRTDDSGCALPFRDDWQTMSEYLNLGNYDDYIDEEWHSAIPQIHPLGKNPGDLWSITLHGFHAVNGKHHFAVYPEEICVRPILSSSRESDIVLDPFVGSGTTCLVAMQYKRRSIGIDLNPDYIQLAKNRIFSGLAEIEMFGGEDEENKHKENNGND